MFPQHESGAFGSPYHRRSRALAPGPMSIDLAICLVILCIVTCSFCAKNREVRRGTTFGVSPLGCPSARQRANRLQRPVDNMIAASQPFLQDTM